MRSGWTPKFRDLLHRPDPALHLIAEVVQVRSSDVKDTLDEWSGADSGLNVQVLDSGGLMLYRNTASAITQGSDDGTLATGLTRTMPAMGLIVEWTGADAERRELANVVARLHPKADGGVAKDVTEWRAAIYRVLERGPEDDRVVVAQIGFTTATAPGVTASDITFDFTDGENIPVVGPAPKYAEAYDGTRTSYPQTLIRVWGVTATGEPASNTAWLADSTLGSSITAIGYSVTHYSISEGYTSQGEERGGGTVILLDSPGGSMPRFTLGRAAYTVAIVTFSGVGNRIQDLGTTGSQEVIADGQAPNGSTLTYEIQPSGGGAWTAVVDGDVIGVNNTARGGSDLSALTPAAAWNMRVTLTPSTDAFTSPIARRLGVREVTTTDLSGVATVSDAVWQVEPRTLKGNITKATVRILKTGERDYLDYGSEILAKNHIGEIEVRVWIGDPTYEYLSRSEWMHIDSFEVEDYECADTAHVLTCISPLRRLRRTIPPFVVTSGSDGTRAPIEYANVTIKVAAADIVDGQVGLPGRFRGPLLEDANLVTKTVRETDAKDELDRLAYLAGCAIITSQGRVKAVTMMGEGQAAPSGPTIFQIGDYTPVYIGPGYATRTDEFFVPFGWVEGEDGAGSFSGESRFFNATATAKLGGRGLQTTERLDDETAKWIPSATLGEMVARRIPNHFANGLMLWEIRPTYGHPHLEPGDPAVIVTDMYAGRGPVGDQEIRGPVAGSGVVATSGDCWGRSLLVWIKAIDDIVLADGAVTTPGYRAGELSDWRFLYDQPSAGQVTVKWTRGSLVAEVWVWSRTMSIPMASDAEPYPAPDEAGMPTAILPVGTDQYVVDVPPAGYATFVQFESRSAAGKVLHLYRYELQSTESVVIPTLDLDGDELYLSWKGLGMVGRVRWLADVGDAPTLTEVRTSGAVDTTHTVLVHTFNPTGDPVQTVYVGVLGETAAGVEVTSLTVVPFTYRTGAPSLPVVSLTYLGRTMDGYEKWLATATGRGTWATLYVRTYSKGSAPPAYTQVGPAQDPVQHFFSFAHPADGAANVVIEAYAVDDGTPALTSDVVYRESDSDVFPSGEVDLTVDAANEVYTTPRTIDTDSLSYRFKAVVAAAGTDAFADPSLVADTDIGVATFAGTGFGTQVKLSGILSAIDALLDGQELYLSGWMFNCAGTSAAAQGAAVKSSKIRRSITPGSARNVIKSAWMELELRYTYPGGPDPVWAFAYWNLATADGTGSLEVSIAEDANPPVVYTINAPGQDGNDSVWAGPATGPVLTLILTPYPGANKGGTAGTPVTYVLDTSKRVGLSLTDQGGGQVIGPLVLNQTGAGAVRVDIEAGTGNVVLNVDINRTTEAAAIDPAADYILIYDASAGENRKVLIADLLA